MMIEQDLQITLFCCSNSYDRDELAQYCNGFDSSLFKLIYLPCSGKVDVPYLMKAFETGADGVAILTCSQEQCQRLEGNMRARRRADAVASLLEEIGVEPTRITVITPKVDETAEVSNAIEKFYNNIKSLPAIGSEDVDSSILLRTGQSFCHGKLSKVG